MEVDPIKRSTLPVRKFETEAWKAPIRPSSGGGIHSTGGVVRARRRVYSSVSAEEDYPFKVSVVSGLDVSVGNGLLNLSPVGETASLTVGAESDEYIVYLDIALDTDGYPVSVVVTGGELSSISWPVPAPAVMPTQIICPLAVLTTSLTAVTAVYQYVKTNLAVQLLQSWINQDVIQQRAVVIQAG